MIWESIRAWVGLYAIELLLALAVICLALVFICIFSLKTAVSLKKRYRSLMMGQEGTDFEALLNHYGNALSESLEKQKAFTLRLAEFERQLALSLTGFGLVRYNAFRETGSDLSFSLALLDRHEDGVVLTSIFGREECRCYGKPVRGGKSTHLLSEEEKSALDEARRRMGSSC